MGKLWKSSEIHSPSRNRPWHFFVYTIKHGWYGPTWSARVFLRVGWGAEPVPGPQGATWPVFRLRACKCVISLDADWYLLVISVENATDGRPAPPETLRGSFPPLVLLLWASCSRLRGPGAAHSALGVANGSDQFFRGVHTAISVRYTRNSDPCTDVLIYVK